MACVAAPCVSSSALLDSNRLKQRLKCSRQFHGKSSSGIRHQRRQRRQTAPLAAAASAQQQQQQQAVSSEFEHYILDLQQRIIQVPHLAHPLSLACLPAAPASAAC